MANTTANKRPAKRKHDSKVFTGTCSNCGAKQVQCTKVGNAQVCLDKCFMGKPAGDDNQPIL